MPRRRASIRRSLHQVLVESAVGDEVPARTGGQRLLADDVRVERPARKLAGAQCDQGAECRIAGLRSVCVRGGGPG